MSEEIPEDRRDRIDALDTILIRMDNRGLTLEEKMEISFDLQIESVRATKLMLAKNFVQRDDLEAHCAGMHSDRPWNLARFGAVSLSTLMVCATVIGIAHKMVPSKKASTQSNYYVAPDNRTQTEK